MQMYDEQLNESREKSRRKKHPHEGVYKIKNPTESR